VNRQACAVPGAAKQWVVDFYQQNKQRRAHATGRRVDLSNMSVPSGRLTGGRTTSSCDQTEAVDLIIGELKSSFSTPAMRGWS